MNENNLKKQLLHLRIQTGILLLILVLAALFVFFLMGKVTAVADQLQRIDMTQINETISSLDSAAQALGKVDTDKLNQGISSFSAVAENLNKLEFDKLMNFMDSLDNLSVQLKGISDFFGAFMK